MEYFKTFEQFINEGKTHETGYDDAVKKWKEGGRPGGLIKLGKIQKRYKDSPYWKNKEKDKNRPPHIPYD